MRTLAFVVLALSGCAVSPPAVSEADPLPTAVAGQLPLPQDLSLNIEPNPAVAGRWMDLSVYGPTPGSTVGLAVSNGTVGRGSCFGWLGGCLDITPGTSGYRFVVLGQGGFGTGVLLATTLPASFTAGDWVFQALSDSGPGGSFVASQPMVRTVLPYRVNCSGDDALEDDDAPNQATPISVGTVSGGRVLCEVDDTDWHKLRLNAGERVIVEADFAHSEGDIDLYVRRTATTNNLSAMNSGYLARGYGTTAPEIVPFTAPSAGNYYVISRLFTDRGLVSGNTYSLRVYPNGPTCTLDFAGAYASLGDGGDPTLFYDRFGVHFAMTSGYGLVGGQVHGDPGDWTNSAAVPDEAWGCVGSTAAEVNTLTFDDWVTNLELTVYAASATVPTEVTVQILRDGRVTNARTVTVDPSGTYARTVSLPGPLDEVRLWAEGGHGAYVIDDVRYDTLTLTCP